MRSVKSIRLILAFILLSEVSLGQSFTQITEYTIVNDEAITNDIRFAIYANDFYLGAIFNYIMVEQFSMFEL